MHAKFDFHTHTFYSDGECSVAAIIEAAETRGLTAVAITDHGPELSVGISPGKIASMIQDIKIAKKDAGLKVLAGMEANILNTHGAIDIDERLVCELDILIAGVHELRTPSSKPREQAWEYLKMLTSAVERQPIGVIAHPFQFYGYVAQHLTREEIEEFIGLAAKKGVAIELNSKYRVPDEEFIQTCLREGVKLSIGTDAHTAGEVGAIDWQIGVLRRVGAKDEDMALHRFLNAPNR